MANEQNTADINDIVEGEISLDNIDSIFEGDFSFEETSIEDDIKTVLNDKVDTPLEGEGKEEEEEEGDDTPPVTTSTKGEEEEEGDDTPPANTEIEEEEEIITTTDTFSQTTSLIDMGIIEDVRISLSDDEEDEGVLLSEFKDISPDQLRKVVEIQKANKDSEISEKYLSKEDFSEDQLRVINILKEGGNLKEIFSSEQELKRPFEGLDIDDEKTQKQIILHHFINNQKLSQKEALALLAQKEKDFEVDSFSKDIVDAYNNKFDEYLTQKEQETAQKREEERKRVAETRKALSKTLKDNKLKDNIVRKVLDGVTKPTADNRLQVHNALEEVLKNPEENYEVLLHLLDRNSYNELYKIKQRKQQTESVIKLIDALPTDKAKKIKDSRDQNADKLTDFEKEIASIKL